MCEVVAIELGAWPALIGWLKIPRTAVEAHSLACTLHWFKFIDLRPSSKVSTEALELAERLSDGDLRPETSETAFMPSSICVILLSTSTTRKTALPSRTLRTLSTSMAEVGGDDL